MDSVVAEAKEWRKIEAFSQSSTSTPPSRQQGSKSAGSSAKWECHRCGLRGHIARNCMAPSPVASGGEQGHSSAARQQRPPHKGNNRGNRGAARGRSSDGGGSSPSTSAHQQQQASKNNSGSSGSGWGGAAPQLTVHVDASSTTASAPVAAPAVPSAAASGAIPAAAPGVTSQSPWFAGWSSYPPAVPFESSGRLHLRSLRGRGVKWGSRRLEMWMKCPWSSRTSLTPLSCAFLTNARGEPLHVDPSCTWALISRVCRCRSWK